MKLYKITSPDLRKPAAFLVDGDDVIRSPDGSFETVAVRFTNGGRTIKSVILQASHGKWHFEPASADPAGTLKALVRLAKRWRQKKEIGVYRNDEMGSTIHVFEWKRPDVRRKATAVAFERAKWALVVHWDSWNAQGLQWKARQTAMNKLGFPEFETMGRTTFETLCTRTLPLKYLPRRK